MEHDSKTPWWQTGWFWGGVVPLLPAGGFLIGIALHVNRSTMPIIVAISAAPVAILLLGGIGLLVSEFLREIWYERKPMMLAFIALIAILSYWGASGGTRDCDAELNLAGQSSCRP